MDTIIFPKVSIITVNYHQEQVTCEMLISIARNTYPNLEVIVVDNDSKYDPSERFQEALPFTQVLLSKKNLGFAGANNLGIQHATGDYLFFLNNDTEISALCIFNLVNRFKISEKVGAVSPKIKFFDKPNTIQYAGFSSMHSITGRNKLIGFQAKDKGQYDKPRPTAYAHGAAMMVSREVIEEVGNMPELYFLYYEELDWCESIKRKGYQIYFEPQALVLHKASISVGKNSPLKTYFYARNRVLFMKRNMGKYAFPLFLLYYVLISFPKSVIQYFFKNQRDNIYALFKGVASSFLLLLNLQENKI